MKTRLPNRWIVACALSAAGILGWHASALSAEVISSAKAEIQVDSVDLANEYMGAPSSGHRSRFAVSPDGADVRAAGVERIWDTDSIYNMEDKPVTLRLRAIDVEVDLP